MTDVVDSQTRSLMMASIKGKNTRPELALRRYLYSLGFRFRLHKKNLPGKPDLVLSKYQLAIFVHGCFWHRHKKCRYATSPSSRKEFWDSKFQDNVDRDERQMQELLRCGWRVLVVWECGLKHSIDELDRLQYLIKGRSEFTEWPLLPPRIKL